MPFNLSGHLYRALILLTLATVVYAASAREVRNFNADWHYHAGTLSGVEAIDTSGLTWQPVHLPHDGAISGPFDPTVSGRQGKLPWKVEGWYKKEFKLSKDDLADGRRAILVFDGVMSNPKVYVNGQLAGSWRYGYNSFWIDITDHVTANQANTVAVHADNGPHFSRWYPGFGIYRKVMLRLVDPVHVPVWGVFVTTPEVTDNQATVRVKTEIVNTSATAQEVVLTTTIEDPAGQTIASQQTTQQVLAGQTIEATQDFELSHPKRWDVNHPHLYYARTELARKKGAANAKTCDTTATRFGIRTFKWTADNGFHLNGRRVQIKGVCLHHDNGPLGGIALKDALERKLRIMKEMGVNSVRTSHNAPSPELLELCDEMGLFVINELFDKWGPTASSDVSTAKFVNELAEPEVRNFIRRDRNHACVVLWAIGNEIGDVLTNKDGQGAQHVTKMNALFKKYDTTRPTNMAMHVPGSVNHGILDALDTMGWNYGQKYLRARERYPHIPQIYTESASTFSTRGFYQFPHPKGPRDFNPNFTETSYDRTAAKWSDIPEYEFMRMERDAYVAGEYVWTGFDYLGEPTPHTDNARSSYFGIVDLVGLPKDRFYLYRAYWRDDDHTVHILPHWNWPERVGKNVPVYVYTDGNEAELFLNGRSLGRRTKTAPGEKLSSDTNLAMGKPASASTEEIKQDAGGNVIYEHRADKAFDGTRDSRWCASDGKTPQWLAVDLGQSEQIGFVMIDWEHGDDRYTYELQISNDGQQWETVGSSATDERSGGRTLLTPDVRARHVRIYVTKIAKRGWASIRELRIERTRPESLALTNPYYDIMHRYRLCWEDVTYEPGELKAVAYKNGSPIGEQTVTTIGPAQRLRLTPETQSFAATGESLIYVLVEAVDRDGRVHPRDMSKVTFNITGPAVIAGIGNGDPTSLDPFQDNTHPLFHGKAVLILRSVVDQTGPITVEAQANGLEAAKLSLSAAAPK